LKARGFFQGADLIVVINGDSLCRWPLKKLLRTHRKGDAAATLVVSERADPQRLGGGIGVGEAGHVAFFRRAQPTPAVDLEGNPEEIRRTVFAGAHTFTPALLDHLEGDGPADFVTDLYEPLLQEGIPIATLATNRDWHDLGTPGRYLEGVLDWVQGRRPKRLLTRRNWIAEGASVAEDAEVSASAIESGAEVGAGATVEGSLLLPGARVGHGSTVRQAILGFDTVLPPGTYLEGRMVNPRRAGFTAGPDDSLLGDLVYTPLERER
jgi:mannose-1-phosphate guanylyltransferase